MTISDRLGAASVKSMANLRLVAVAAAVVVGFLQFITRIVLIIEQMVFIKRKLSRTNKIIVKWFCHRTKMNVERAHTQQQARTHTFA